jgi:hypothetical protein
MIPTYDPGNHTQPELERARASLLETAGFSPAFLRNSGLYQAQRSTPTLSRTIAPV